MSRLPQLPVELEARIFELLSQNEIACTIRLVNKAAAQRYRGPQHTIVQLSQPVPQHAFEERCQANQKEWLRALPYKKRLQLLCLMAASGDLPNLEVAMRAAGCALTGKVMEAAAAAGHIHVCQSLRQMGCPWGSALDSAAGAGCREVCEWLLASDCPLTDGEYGDEITAVLAAVKGGHMDLAVWLQQQLWESPESPEPSPSNGLVVAAAHGCDLATLQRLYRARQIIWRLQRGDEFMNDTSHGDMADILQAAASSPTPDWREKVEWLEGDDSDRIEGRAAIQPNGVDRLRWLRERDYELDGDAVQSAVRGGNAAALQYLLGEVGGQVASWYALRPAWLTHDVQVAAEKGHLAALQVLHAHGCLRRNMRACLKSAAAEGHLAVVVWLVDTFGLSAADLQADAVGGAARSGSMELLCWLAERGCDFAQHDKVLEEAAGGGCEVAMEWLLERGCRWPGDVSALYIAAASNGDLATLACLRRLGCPWGPNTDLLTTCIRAFAFVESFRPLPVLRWLVEAGCPVDWGAALKAADKRVHPYHDDENLDEVAAENMRVDEEDEEDEESDKGWVEVAAWLKEEQKRWAAGSS